MENNNENANTETVCDITQDSLFNRNVMAERGMDTKGSSNTDRTPNLLANPATNKTASSKTGSAKEKEHVIYGLIDPRNNMVTYVGYSSQINVRIAAHIGAATRKLNAKVARCSPKDTWIVSLLKNNLKPLFIVIERTSKENWKQAERHWISHYKNINPNLTNTGAGGEGFEACDENKIYVTVRLSISVTDELKRRSQAQSLPVSAIAEQTLAVFLGV